MSGQQSRNIFQNFTQNSISNKIKQILSENDSKGNHSLKQLPKPALIIKQRINTNPRPLTTQLQFQQQNFQQQTCSIQNLQQINQPTQNNSLNNKIRFSMDSTPFMIGGKDSGLRIQTSFPCSPSMSYTKITNQQFISTPSYSEFGDTKGHYGFQNLSNSTPIFNKNMIISTNNQNNFFDKADEIQQQEVYVVHNSQGNKYRSKLNSQVKTKLNKKNEIIKQFLIKNMKPNESKGFQNWQIKNDSRYSISSFQNTEQKDIQTTSSLIHTNPHQINPTIMQDGQNRQFVINDQIQYKRPATSFLQRSKLLIPQTKANKELYQQSMVQINKQSNNISSPSNQIAFQNKNTHINEKLFSNQNKETSQVNTIQNLQNPYKNLEGLIQNQKQFYIQNNNLQKVIDSEENHQPLLADQHLLFKNEQKKQQMSSSLNAINPLNNSNKGLIEKKFKNQTEQTNFPEYNMNSLSSWQDQKSIEKIVLTQERDDFNDMDRYQSSEKEKINPTNFSQQSIKVTAIQKMQQQQQQIQTDNIVLSSSKQQQQISSQKNLKVIPNLDNSRKKSIRGWSINSDDEQINNQDNIVFKQKQK